MEQLFLQWKSGHIPHHCYIVSGNIPSITDRLVSFCQKEIVPAEKWSTSILRYHADRLLIDDARSMVARACLKTEQGSTKVFIVSFTSITPEAQNAFLKMIEEPTTDTVFFFIVPRTDFFLPTVLSRSVVIQESFDKTSQYILKELVKKTIGERITWADDIVKKISDEKLPRGYAREVISSLIKEVEKEIRAHPAYIPCLKQLLYVDDYLGDTSASIKILLEKAVLSIPA